MEDTLIIEGKHFQSQYMVYVIELIHDKTSHFYVGQTGDHRYVSARSALRRLMGHLEDRGHSTQNQIYRYVAAELLGSSEAGKTGTFSEELKDKVEKFLVRAEIRMHLFEAQDFVPGVSHAEHLNIVRQVRQLESSVIGCFADSGQKLINKNVPKKVPERCSFPEALNEIKKSFSIE